MGCTDNQAPERAWPELVAIEVREYKNLRNLWLPWSDGLALFGINGVGKTNLLECLALLMGNGQTVGLARSRLQTPQPDDLSLLARPGASTLPWPPDFVLPLAPAFERLDPPWPSAARVLSDASWWRLLGSSGGADFSTGLAAASISPPVRAAVIDWSANPVIRYSLTSMERSQSSDVQGADIVKRTFARTLMAPAIPGSVRQVASELPDAFAPLQTYLAAPEETLGEWISVLELPSTSEPPATVQWLPRERKAEEINSDLQYSFTHGGDSVADLTSVLGERLPFLIPLTEGDWHWLSHEIGAKRAQAELDATLPAVQIYASGGGDADFAVIAGDQERTHTGDPDVLDVLSSGERRWADEALATAGRELMRFGDLAALHVAMFDALDDDTVMHAVEEVADRVEEELRTGEFWSGEAFEHLLKALEPELLAAARLLLQDENPLTRQTHQELYPGLSQLQPQLLIRVFDEPEAHLHPTAQRRLATALDRLRHRGQNIVIASHSPHFLDLPGWSQVHVRRVEGETQLERIAPAQSTVRSALASELGVTRGELLAGINAVLIVEGAHDQLMLQRLFGDQLDDAGIAVLRMFGTSNLLATAELDFLDRYLDVPIIVMLDNTRLDHIASGRTETDEEEKLLRLKKSCRRRRRPYIHVGLTRPDIVCYLSEAAVRYVSPSFPGWPDVVSAFERRTQAGPRPQFKPWLRDRFKVDLTRSDHIRAVLARMQEQRNQPAGELTRRVNEILSQVTAATFDPRTSA